MTLALYLYLVLRVLLAIMIAEAGWRHFFWWEKNMGRELRFIPLGVAVIAVALEMWDGALIFRGFQHRALGVALGTIVDIGLLGGFALLTVSTWLIDFRMSQLRLIGCMLGRIVAASLVAFALVRLGLAT